MEKLQFSRDEVIKLSKLTSLCFGLASKNSQKCSAHSTQLLKKAIAYLESLVLVDNKTSPTKQSREPSEVAYLYLGHFNLLLHRWEDALSAYKEFEKTGSLDPDFLYGYALCLFRFDSYIKAVSVLKDLLYSCPTFTARHDVHFRLGFALSLLSHRGSSVMRHFQMALLGLGSHSVAKVEVLFQVAAHLARLGKFREEVEVYQQLLAMDHSASRLSPAARLLCLSKMGHAYERQYESTTPKDDQLAERAIETYKSALELDADNAQLWYHVGRLHIVRGNVHDAFMAFRTSIDKAEADTDTWCSVGTLYQLQQQRPDALQAYFCAIQLDECNATAWKNLGVLYESVLQFSDALFCYNKAIEADQQHTICPPAFVGRVQHLRSELSRPGFVEPPNLSPDRLPTVSEAVQLAIPGELKQRREYLLKLHENGGSRNHTVSVSTKTDEFGVEFTVGVNSMYGKPASSVKSAVSEESLRLERSRAACRAWMGELCGYSDLAMQAMLTPLGVKSAHEPPTPTEPETTRENPNEDKPIEAEPATDETTHPESQEGENILKPSESESPKEINSTCLLEALLKLRRESSSSVKPSISMTSEEVLTGVWKDPHSMDLLTSQFFPSEQPSTPRPNDPSSTLITVMKEPLSLDLTPKVKAIYVDTRKEAESVDSARAFNSSTPVLVWRGLCTVLRVDLTMFSSAHLARVHGDEQLPVLLQSSSTVSTNATISTVKEYTRYQAHKLVERKSDTLALRHFHAAQQSSLNATGIRFGTPCVVRGSDGWSEEVVELSKLPQFMRPYGPHNALSLLSSDAVGVAVHLHVTGCRVPVNLWSTMRSVLVHFNTGPADWEWFCVDSLYLPQLYHLCSHVDKEDFMSGQWWPRVESLVGWRVPVCRFLQHPGDVLRFHAGAVFWGQALGFGNSVSWRVAQMSHEQFRASLAEYEFHTWEQVPRPPAVPMLHLAWNIARGIVPVHKSLFQIVKHLLLCCLVRYQATLNALGNLGVELASVPEEVKAELSSSSWTPPFCDICESEVFGLVFTRPRGEEQIYKVHCFPCASMMEPKLCSFLAVPLHDLEEIQAVYDEFQWRTETLPAFAVASK